MRKVGSGCATPRAVPSNSGKIKVIEFNKEFFSRAGLKVTSKLYSNEQSFVFVDQFKTEAEASEYSYYS